MKAEVQIKEARYMKAEELIEGRLYNAIATDGKKYEAVKQKGIIYCLRPAFTPNGCDNKIVGFEEVEESEV